MSTPSQALAGTQPATVSDLQSHDAPATHQVTDGSIQPVTPSKILMIAPTGGESALVPPDQVDSYLAKGAKVGVRMTAPDGKQKAIVPFDQQDQYQKQGATWDVHPDNDSAKAFLTQRQQAPDDFEAQQDEAKQSVESGAGPAAAYMKPGQTAAAVGGMLAAGSAAGIVSGIMGLAAPGVITEEVATGLLDEFGAPIARQIAKEGPSVLGKGFQLATKWIQAHPTTAKAVIETVGVAAAVKILGKMAKLAQEFGGK